MRFKYIGDSGALQSAEARERGGKWVTMKRGWGATYILSHDMLHWGKALKLPVSLRITVQGAAPGQPVLFLGSLDRERVRVRTSCLLEWCFGDIYNMHQPRTCSTLSPSKALSLITMQGVFAVTGAPMKSCLLLIDRSIF